MSFRYAYILRKQKKKGYDLKIVRQLFGDDGASATSADKESERARERGSERESARERSPDRPERVRAQVPAVIFMEIGLLSPSDQAEAAALLLRQVSSLSASLPPCPYVASCQLQLPASVSASIFVGSFFCLML
jgi:hypothetical protein